MNFANVAMKETQVKKTENGAIAFNTLNSKLLDFFSTAGAMRPRSIEDIQRKFELAFNENREYAMRALFYTRDIRNGGIGERRTFRACLQWLSDNHPDLVEKNLHNVIFFGRFDDLYCLFDTRYGRNKEDVINVIAEVLQSDIQNMKERKEISLLGKWLPSANTSSKQTRTYARTIYNGLGITEKTYRKTLSILRKYLKVTEKLMSAKQWSEIQYESVPSYAMKNYRNAFKERDSKRFNEYLAALQIGEKKVNASTLYPYDLVHQYMNGLNGYGCWSATKKMIDPVIEEQWKALPNYVSGENDFIVMADVSGSMYGRPMETSVGLATYFAQRNKGAYKNLYMTFTDRPHFVSLAGCTSLRDCVETVMKTDVGYNTNLEAAFNHILDTAVKNRVKANEMPKALVVISDMEIDRYSPARDQYGRTYDFVGTMKQKFKMHGYELPKLVMWNVEARQDTYLTQGEDVIFVSGQSAAVFKQLCGTLEGKTAYDFMIDTLNAKVYNRVVCA